jgi:hypothetical protein
MCSARVQSAGRLPATFRESFDVFEKINLVSSAQTRWYLDILRAVEIQTSAMRHF